MMNDIDILTAAFGDLKNTVTDKDLMTQGCYLSRPIVPHASIPLHLNDVPINLDVLMEKSIPDDADLVLYACWASLSDRHPFSFANTKFGPLLKPEHHLIIQPLIERTGFTGESFQLETDRTDAARRIGVFGLGNPAIHRRENVFAAGLNLGQIVKQSRIKHCAIVLDESFGAEDLKILLWRINCGAVPYNLYKGRDVPIKSRLEALTVVNVGIGLPASIAKSRARALGVGSVLAMTLCDAPSNFGNSLSFTQTMEDLFDTMPNMSVRILDQHQCGDWKMGCFLGAARGSVNGARLVHLMYRNGSAARKVAYVGLGVTPNVRGGPRGSHAETFKTKCGRAGASLVAGAAMAIGLTQPEDVEVHFICLLHDNVITDRSMCSGDILRAMNGTTVEVVNTESSGVLALADGLCYAQHYVRPGEGCVVDIGAFDEAAAGPHVGSLYTNSAKCENRILESAGDCGEALWAMPLRRETRRDLDSRLADLKNHVELPVSCSSSYTALFLNEFINPQTEWIHIDATGPVWDHIHDRPTGWGLGFLTEFILD